MKDHSQSQSTNIEDVTAGSNLWTYDIVCAQFDLPGT
jgi:hypothetical protein